MPIESSIIQVFVDILWDDLSPPTPTYRFSGPGGIVSASGQIDLSNHAKRVLILFILGSEGDEMFDSQPIAVGKITQGCPVKGSPLAAAFKDPTLDPTRRMLAVTDHNIGNAKDKYQYALFFTDHIGNAIVPPCDPVIVNR